MGTTNIPLVTLSPNQVINSSVIPQLVQPVGSFTDFSLLLNRNVGTASLDTTTTANISLVGEWSSDGGITWNPGISALISGGILFKDKAHTIRQEVSSIEWPWPSSTTHIRGTVTNGGVAVSVSGSVTLA